MPDRVALIFRTSPENRKALRQIALELDTTVQDLLYTELYNRYLKPRRRWRVRVRSYTT